MCYRHSRWRICRDTCGVEGWTVLLRLSRKYCPRNSNNSFLRRCGLCFLRLASPRHWCRAREISRTADYTEQSHSQQQEAPTARAPAHPYVKQNQANKHLMHDTHLTSASSLGRRDMVCRSGRLSGLHAILQSRATLQRSFAYLTDPSTAPRGAVGIGAPHEEDGDGKEVTVSRCDEKPCP